MNVVIEKLDRGSNPYRLTTELIVPVRREKVFDFFSDAHQLEKLTPPWMRFRVLTRSPIEMTQGTEIDYKLRVHGLPMRWKSLISTWEPPFQFVDEQLKGPYYRWHHRHTFEQLDSGTRICDTIDYAVPLGWIMHPLMVQRDLKKIFSYRCEVIRQIFTPMTSTASIQERIS